MTTLERRATSVEANPAVPVRAIAGLAGIEMWERFSFYGMQAIMAYYLYHSVTDGGLGIPTATATALMGAYGGLVYVSCVLGGIVADRILGSEKTLLAGAWLLIVGHASLAALPGVSGVAVGLPAIAVGSGALKASAITILGLVTFGPVRDVAFSIFYFGINVGALFGPLLTGILKEQAGFHYAFGAAATLMVIGMVNYLALRKKWIASLDAEHQQLITRAPSPFTRSQLALFLGAVAAIVAVVTGVLVTGLVPLAQAANYMLAIVLLVTLALFVSIVASPAVTHEERATVWRYLPLFACSAYFWTLASQYYGVFAVYSDVRLDRHLGGWEMPASWTQSFNPLFTFIFIPLLTLAAKTTLGRLPAATKMPYGLALASLGPLVFLTVTGGGPGSVPLLVLVAAVALMTAGEMWVGPIGMSVTTEYAPAKFRVRFSAFFFLSMACGTALTGVVSRFYNPEDAAAEHTYFLTLSAAGVVIALIAGAVNRLARRG